MTRALLLLEGTPLVGNPERAAKSPEPETLVNKVGAIPNTEFGWTSARAAAVTRSVGLDYSLAFHRLQEARQGLHRARSQLRALSAREGAMLVAYCEANLARAEQWVARTLVTETMIASAPLPPAASRLQVFSGQQ